MGSPGLIAWRELMTGDVAAARAFYAGLLGWTYVESGVGPPEGKHAWIESRGVRIGAMWTAPEGTSARWMPFVSVDDLDAAVGRAKSAKIVVSIEASAYPGLGRYAAIEDPYGAEILMLERTLAGEPREPKSGELVWETLTTHEIAGAEIAYARLFGWSSDNGPEGTGTVLTCEGRPIADVQIARRGPPRWITYAGVDDLDASVARARELGATVHLPRLEIGKVGAIAFLADPTGAAIALFERAA